jgi:hypothetical protein
LEGLLAFSFLMRLQFMDVVFISNAAGYFCR